SAATPLTNDRFLSMFFEEARELLQALESGLMDLEAKQGDRAHLDRTFRAAHTLKGAAGMVGLGRIAEFTHAVEAVLDKIRGGTLAVRAEVINPLLEARDHLVAAVDAAEAGNNLEAPRGLVDRLVELVEGEGPAKAAESAPTPVSTLAGYRITLTPNPDL